MVEIMNYKKVFLKSDKIIILFSYIIFLLIFSLGSSINALGLYCILILLSIKYNFIPLILIGCSNYLPTIYNLSPIVMSSLALFIVILIKGINRGTIRVYRIKYPWELLGIIGVWSLLTGLVNRELNFFSNIIMAIIFLLLFFEYYFSVLLSSEEILQYLLMGIFSGVIFTTLIELGINGFQSNHIFRLAIGERSDPNSTGLLFAILCTYLLLKWEESLSKSIFQTIIYAGCFILSLICLLLTQSRGSFFSFIVVFLIYMLSKKKRFLRVSKNFILGIFILIVIAIFLFIINKNIQHYIITSWQAFSSRLSFSDAGDGARVFLFQQSIKSFFNNPVLGTNMSSFEKIAGHITHNTFSDYMVTNGIVGIIFFILFFFKPLVSFFRYREMKKVSKIYFCYMTCFINILCYSASNEKLLFILVALLYFSVLEEKEKNTTGEKNGKKYNITWSY